MSSMQSTEPSSMSWRKVVVAVAALVGVVVTFQLGQWQSSRAQEKLGLQARLAAQTALPALQSAEMLSSPLLWQQVHRRVVLKGQWLTDQTIYLDNRNHHGKAGFWVMTPLRWSPGQVVWVQRGWIQRDLADATKAPLVQTPDTDVVVEGRIAAPLSQMVELGSAQTQTASAHTQPRIQANLDMASMRALVTDNVSAVVIQTGEASEGLRRDWPVVAGSADKNKGYAFQWFALCALIAGLYIWFQWIQPFRRHAQSTTDQR